LACFDTSASVLPCGAQVDGLTLWVKRTDAVGARYAEVENVDPRTTVSKLIARWVASEKLDVTPSLVNLRLVKRGPGGVPTAEQESEALQSPTSLLVDPSQTLAEAGVSDGSWLLAVSSTQHSGAYAARSAREPTALLTCPLANPVFAANEELEKRVRALEATSLDPWEDLPSDSSRLRKDFRNRVILFYNADDNAAAQCMVTGSRATGHKGVIAAHIWPSATKGVGLARFGLAPQDIHSPRNGMLLLKSIESAFDQKRVAFAYNSVRRTFDFAVLDRSLDLHPIDATSDAVGAPSMTTFKHFHGKPLQLPPASSEYGAFPFRRLLAWHFVHALDKAVRLKSRDEEELAKYYPVVAEHNVRSWLTGTSPSASWPGAVEAGLRVMRDVRKDSVRGDESGGDDIEDDEDDARGTG